MELEDKAKKILEKIKDVKYDRISQHNAWLRNIIAMAVGFLGISVGLKDQTSDHHSTNQLIYLFWNLELLCLLVGIVAGTTRLYGTIRQQDSLVAHLYKTLEKQEYKNNQSFPATHIQLKKVYKVAAKVCYISFVLALVCVFVVSLLERY